MLLGHHGAIGPGQNDIKGLPCCWVTMEQLAKARMASRNFLTFLNTNRHKAVSTCTHKKCIMDCVGFSGLFQSCVDFCAGLQVRLKETVYGRSRTYLGGVQVNRYGFWGPVCNSSWDDRDANATCHGLGFQYGITYFGRDLSRELCFHYFLAVMLFSGEGKN